MEIEERSYFTLIAERVSKRGSHYLNEYECVCGKRLYLEPSKVKRLKPKSCGCKTNDFISAKNSTHNLSKHPLFKVWAGIIRRCYSESATKYEYYGARGVRVCDEWRYNFKSFYDWALANGWKKGLQIDKDIIPRKLGIPAMVYSPELCCVVTNKENANGRSSNRVIEYNGEKNTISQWADRIGVNQMTLWKRINRWGVEKAISDGLIFKNLN